MIDQNSNIDRLFKEGLVDLEVTPPHDVWEGVHERIRKKSRKIPLFYRAAAASVLLFIMAGSAWLLFFNQPETQDVADLMTVQEESALTPSEGAEDTGNQATELPLPEEPQTNLEKQKDEPGLIASIAETETDEITLAEETVEQTEQHETDQFTRDSEPEVSIRTEPVLRSIAVKNNAYLPVSQPVTMLSLTADEPAQETWISSTVEAETIPELLEKEIPRWSVGGQFSPVYSFRYIGQNNLDSYRDIYNSHENGLFTFAGGLHVQYNANRKIKIYTGIYYSRMGQQIDDIQLYRSENNVAINLPIKGNLDISNSIGSITSQNDALYFKDQVSFRIEPQYLPETYDPIKEGLIPINADIIQNMDYIEIPLVIRYKVVDRRVDLNLLGGVSSNFMVRNEAYASYEGSKINIGETQGLRTVNYSSTLGIGLEYELTETLSLNLEPALKYYINSINRSDNLKTHPYTIGIFTGLSYIFK